MASLVESVGVVDTEAGMIVWVRRRNGSWWPGRILGAQDLGASHLMSPRSGTPVKLLGREDASVDWYNLEKSKRVKAFRCGEFDDCIERAEGSHRLPAKRCEKYARREDAILHALELEKQFLEIKCVKSVKPKGKSTEAERKLSITTVKSFENGNSKLDSHELCQPSSRVNKSCLMEKNGVPSLAQKAKHAIPPGLEDHCIMVGSQIKELQGVGLKAVPLNTMFFSTASEDSNRTAIDGQVYGVPGSGPCLENSTDSDSRISIGKGKRLLDSYTEEAVPKRHRMVHPFVNVRRSNEELPSHSLRPDMCALGLSGEGSRCSESTPAESSHKFSGKQGLQGQTELRFSRPDVGASSAQLGPFAETISGSSEYTESDSSETHSIEQNVEAGMLLSDTETCVRVQPGLRDRLAMQAGPKGISSDESDKASFEDKSQLNFLEHNPSDAEVSRWQLKGKRNVRNMGKRFTQRTYFDPTRGPMSLTETSHCQSYGHDNIFSNDAVFSQDDFDHHPLGYGQRGYLPFQAEAKRHNYTGPNMIDWESGLGRPLRGYWGERSDCFSPMFAGRNWQDMLMDVDLQVQANCQGEHVPWVSLMSKLIGKAIIGHPVQIESLEDGSTDILLSTSDNEFRYESDGGNVPPVWKTARRTANVRPLRPHQLSEPQLDIDENTDYQPHHQSVKKGSKKSPAPSSGRKGSLSKITNSHVSRPPHGTNKAYRKVNSLSTQKTKPLSSVGFSQVTNRTSGKPVVSGSTTVACIPVKLAFSRLLEAVGLPSS